MSAADWPEQVRTELARELASATLRHDVPLSSFTTYGVGGPADFFLQTHAEDEILRAMAVARRCAMPVFVLGGGSNTLVCDAGVRGLVVRIHGGEARAEGLGEARADAGVALNSLVRWAIGHGLAGLEAWAGTPGSVGGAIFGNAHYAGRSIGDLVSRARLLLGDGTVAEVPGSDMAFHYDDSRLRHTGELLLSVVFELSPGADPDALRAVARQSLAHRKRTQPLAMPSAGCVFQNPDPAIDQVPEGIPWSAGALIDRAGLKGASVGGARVSMTHANFIVNEGTATAADIVALVDRCRAEVRRQFGVELREEIVRVGC